MLYQDSCQEQSQPNQLLFNSIELSQQNLNESLRPPAHLHPSKKEIGVGGLNKAHVLSYDHAPAFQNEILVAQQAKQNKTFHTNSKALVKASSPCPYAAEQQSLRNLRGPEASRGIIPYRRQPKKSQR
mmetsp:Transcript_16618/g.28315  ORF Transcript_16618/g.28315 Transcript_16618/m.28315 type:complete len:128 (+) Transcript_16618:1079-1462(+)